MMSIEDILHQLEEHGLEVKDTKIGVHEAYSEFLLADSINRTVYLRVLSDTYFLSGFEVLKSYYDPIVGRNYVWPNNVTSDTSNELCYEGKLTYMAVRVGAIKTQFNLNDWSAVLQIVKRMCA